MHHKQKKSPNKHGIFHRFSLSSRPAQAPPIRREPNIVDRAINQIALLLFFPILFPPILYDDYGRTSLPHNVLRHASIHLVEFSLLNRNSSCHFYVYTTFKSHCRSCCNQNIKNSICFFFSKKAKDKCKNC